MTYYGAKETRAIVPHVRNNTITIAEEIAEEKYGFRPAEGCLSIPAQLCLRIYPQSRTVIEHYGPRWRAAGPTSPVGGCKHDRPDTGDAAFVEAQGMRFFPFSG
jgi:hypothetical protein